MSPATRSPWSVNWWRLVFFAGCVFIGVREVLREDATRGWMPVVGVAAVTIALFSTAWLLDVESRARPIVLWLGVGTAVIATAAFYRAVL